MTLFSKKHKSRKITKFVTFCRCKVHRKCDDMQPNAGSLWCLWLSVRSLIIPIRLVMIGWNCLNNWIILNSNF